MTDDRPVISARVLAAIDAFAGRRLRRAYVHDPEVSAGLREIERIALVWRRNGGADATKLADQRDPAASLMTTHEVAGWLGVTPNAVRASCRTGRIPGRKRGREWLITVDDAAAYMLRMRHRQGGTQRGQDDNRSG